MKCTYVGMSLYNVVDVGGAVLVKLDMVTWSFLWLMIKIDSGSLG